MKNKPSQSSPIRKGKMTKEEIKKTAEELTKNQLCIKSSAPKNHNKVHSIFSDCKRDSEGVTTYTLTTTGSAIKTYKTIVETKAPKIEIISGENIKLDYTKPSNHITAKKIEPVEHGNYEIYSEYVKAHCKVHDTYETTAKELSKLFPQNKSIYDIVRNLKRSHNISWRRVENGDNDTYIFFVEPTREELIVQLTSAESKVIELEKQINDYNTSYVKRGSEIKNLTEENSQLKSDLFYSQRSNIITLAFAIGAVITIIIKSVAL